MSQQATHEDVSPLYCNSLCHEAASARGAEAFRTLHNIESNAEVSGRLCLRWISSLQGSTILYYTILYYTILYYTILYYTILYYTILYYTILYYTILYHTILYYTGLRHERQFTVLHSCSRLGHDATWAQPQGLGLEAAAHIATQLLYTGTVQYSTV